MLRRNAANVLIPVAFGVVVLICWEQFVNWRDIKPFILPTPSSIWEAAIDRSNFIRESAWVSGLNALVGLLLGIATGTLMAMMTIRFRFVSELVAPIAAAVSAIPIVVIVTILTKLFGVTNQVPRRLMVMIIVFFIVYVNVQRGLRQTNATQLELMRSYAASEQQVMRKVRVPNSLPFLFTAIKIAAPLSVTTSFVAEYFGGLQDGLGYKITSSIASSKHANGWAYVGAACVLGLVFFAVASLLEYIAVPWQRRRQSL